MQIKSIIVSCHTADSKLVKQEVNGKVMLPPIVFPGISHLLFAGLPDEQISFWIKQCSMYTYMVLVLYCSFYLFRAAPIRLFFATRKDAAPLNMLIWDNLF